MYVQVKSHERKPVFISYSTPLNLGKTLRILLLLLFHFLFYRGNNPRPTQS